MPVNGLRIDKTLVMSPHIAAFHRSFLYQLSITPSWHERSMVLNSLSMQLHFLYINQFTSICPFRPALTYCSYHIRDTGSRNQNLGAKDHQRFAHVPMRALRFPQKERVSVDCAVASCFVLQSRQSARHSKLLRDTAVSTGMHVLL